MSKTVFGYLKKQANDTKKPALRVAAIALIAVMLLTGLTACGVPEFIKDIFNKDDKIEIDKTNQPPQLEMRPLEEIKETGITSEDVLAALDNLAKEFFLAGELYRFEGLEDYRDDLTYRFSGITPNDTYIPVSGDPDGKWEERQKPFYVSTLIHYADHRWLDEIKEFNNVYNLNFSYIAYLGNKPREFYVKSLAITKEEFESIMKAGNIDSFEINKEYTDSLGPKGSAYENFWEYQAYPDITIDREFIENASEEQLWALYNAINGSLTSINLYGKLPD